MQGIDNGYDCCEADGKGIDRWEGFEMFIQQIEDDQYHCDRIDCSQDRYGNGNQVVESDNADNKRNNSKESDPFQIGESADGSKEVRAACQ